MTFFRSFSFFMTLILFRWTMMMVAWHDEETRKNDGWALMIIDDGLHAMLCYVDDGHSFFARLLYNSILL